MDPLLICCIAEGVVILLLVIADIILLVKNKKPIEKSDDLVVKDGVRYSKTAETHNEDGSVAVTHKKGDVLLEVNKTYTAEKNGYLIPGKYVVLSSAENFQEFKMRIGGFVRTVKHGDVIVVKEGDEITAVSVPVILR